MCDTILETPRLLLRRWRPEDLAPFSVRTGPRVGIDYAQEAVHFPWRYRITP